MYFNFDDNIYLSEWGRRVRPAKSYDGLPIPYRVEVMCFSTLT